MNVLIIDDSRAMRLLIRRALRRMPAISVHSDEAADAMQAWHLLREGAYDLILSDWNMPGMTGIDLLKRLRRAGVETPFGFITVECCQESVDAARSAGAAFVLNKPFSDHSLAAAVAPWTPT